MVGITHGTSSQQGSDILRVQVGSNAWRKKGGVPQEIRVEPGVGESGGGERSFKVHPLVRHCSRNARAWSLDGVCEFHEQSGGVLVGWACFRPLTFHNQCGALWLLLHVKSLRRTPLESLAAKLFVPSRPW